MVHEDFFKVNRDRFLQNLKDEIYKCGCVSCEDGEGDGVYHRIKALICKYGVDEIPQIYINCNKEYLGEFSEKVSEEGSTVKICVEKYYGDLIVENPLLVSGSLYLDGEFVIPMRAKSKIKLRNLEVGEHSLRFQYKLQSIKCNVVIEDGEVTNKKLFIPKKFEENFFKDLEYEFLETCNKKTPDYFRLREILSLDEFNANVKTEYGDETALYLAVRNKNLELCSFLVENGVNINMPNIKNRTPIMVACATGNYEIFKYLLENGASLDVIDICGDSLLIKIISSENRDFDILKTLVENGQDINYKNEKDGDTILIRALRFAPDEYVDYLLEKGANIFVEDKKGLNPLDIAVENNRCKYSKKFLELGLRPKKKHTFIELAKRNLFELLKDAVNDGVDVNTCESMGSTALIEAVKLDNLNMVEFLIERGASLELEDENGETAIFHSRSKNVLKKLIENGADINRQNKEGKNPFEKFINRFMGIKDTELLKIYLENGASL